MPRQKTAQRESIQRETRQRLLDAAATQFAREGFAGANINRISLAAGFAKGTIYNYFDSKRALLLALIDETAAQHAAFIASRVLEHGEPEQRLRQFFRAGFDFVNQAGDRALVMLTVLYGHDPQFKVHLGAAYRPLFDLVGEQILAPGMGQGAFRPVDAQATAGLLMTIYLGTASQLGPDGRTLLDAAQVADFVLHALRRADPAPALPP